MQRQRHGFTLIEVMITIAIVAILGAVALPAYFDSIRKGRRADAISALSRAQQAQERYRANNPSYGDSFTNVAGTLSAASGATQTFASSDGYYTVDITTSGDSQYTLVAYANAGTTQAKDANCQCLQLAASAGLITYGAGGTGGAFNGTLGACGAFTTGAVANRCWRR